MKEAIFTYQTKLNCLQETSQTVLEKTESLLCRVERSLFADYAKGNTLNSLKSAYLQKHGITARQFNAIRFQLEGKIDPKILYEALFSDLFGELFQRFL